MRHSRQFSVLALCAMAALGFGVTSCDDEAASVTRSKLNETCSQDKPCEEGLVCGDEGKCVEEAGQEPEDKAGLGEDCGEEKACEEGLVCGDEGKCVNKNDQPAEPDPGNINTDPCKTANCPDGTACLDGRCYDEACITNGSLKTCDGGQMCVKGECVDDGCQDKTCDEGEICSKGICEDALCLQGAIICNEGSTCVKGNCIDNACLSKTCDTGLTCVKGDCVFPACVGKEACTGGKVCNASGECVYEVSPELLVQADDKETDEYGDTASVSLSLNHPPVADVTLECEIASESPVPEAEVNCSGILFNAANYSEPQGVTVIGLADNKIDSDQKFKLTMTTRSEDPDFNGLVQSLDMVNKNVDTVGVKLSDTNLLTTENGGTAVFSVSLITKPAADVTITIASSNPQYGIIDGAEENVLTVTFTPEDWETPKEITIKGVDDDAPNGDEGHNYQITFTVASEDVDYNGIEVKPISVVNLDNDVHDVFFDKNAIETLEGGAPVSVTARLGLEPVGQVKIGLKVMNGENEAEIAGEKEIVIDKSNYKEGVAFSVQGLVDNKIDGDKDYQVRVRINSNDDDAYEGLDDKFIPGKNIDTDKADLRLSYTSTLVTEAGSTIDIGVSLMSIPTAPVTVRVKSTNDDEMRVSPSEFEFTAENWNVPQTVTVTGQDDVIDDGDQISQAVFSIFTDDKDYAALEDINLDITTQDNDTAEIVVVSAGRDIREDSRETVEFKVVLGAQPQDGKVIVRATSSDESELKLLGNDTVSFDKDNWNTPQSFVLQVQDDNYADGTQVVHVDLESASSDTLFNGLHAQTENYNILDNESASVTLTAAKTLFKPGDQYTTPVTVALSAPPMEDVTVTINTTNATTASLDKTSLVFTTSNWNTPQTINMTNKDPQAASAAKTIETLSAVTTGKGSYNNLKSNEVKLTMYAFISKEFSYTGNVQQIDLLPGNYRLQVWGARGGNDTYAGANGGYAVGVYKKNDKKPLYVYVGGQGSACATNAGGGWNGGGNAGAIGCSGGGGGATDIRTVGGAWNLAASLDSRIIVAGGGGGGGNTTSTCVGGVGGGTNGGGSGVEKQQGKGGTQTAGYAKGQGGHPAQDGGGGGGGYWGGYGSAGYDDGGGGGSGYVSPILTSASTTAGNAAFPNTAGSGNETGHATSGYAKITLID
ncbi:MAG: hypothetical protein IJ165_07890 [Proteobacteria bacterium]|nr:hypothetical protein [Pseudomonadota bacterium]